MRRKGLVGFVTEGRWDDFPKQKEHMQIRDPPTPLAMSALDQMWGDYIPWECYEGD